MAAELSMSALDDAAIATAVEQLCHKEKRFRNIVDAQVVGQSEIFFL
jgi:hypothetical protein